MAQWLRRLPTEQEIPGSSPGVVAFAHIAFCKKCSLEFKTGIILPQFNDRRLE